MAVRTGPALIAATALVGLAACGSASAAGAGHQAAGRALCTDGRGADGRGADRVVVSRAGAPRQVTIGGATQVRAMVAALCALPVMPAGRHCPAAGSVRLVFAVGAQSFPPVVVQTSGCHAVSGLGATRGWSGSSSFGLMLDEAVGGLGRLTPGTHPSSVPFGP